MMPEDFSIAGKALKLNTADDIQPYLDELSSLGNLGKIDFSGNTLGIEASKAIAQHINSHEEVWNNVSEVNFADLYTSRLVEEVVESLSVLLPALLKCPKLEVLNLSDNAFGLRTIGLLEDYIGKAIGLKTLLLANNGMGPIAGARIGRALYVLAERKKAASAPMLETFVCGRNRLENGSARYLAIGLKKHGAGLKKVRLYQNGIRPEGISILIRHGLKYNTHLEILDLQDNTFTNAGSVVLAEALPSWKDSLKELNVNDCLLKGAGCNLVLEAILESKFYALKSLKLQYNEMTQSTLENVLLPAIKKKDVLTSLESLEINGNRLEEDSDALSELQQVFTGKLDELDDLEELDTDDEEEVDTDNEEEEEEPTSTEDDDSEAAEKELSQYYVDLLTKELEGVHLAF